MSRIILLVFFFLFFSVNTGFSWNIKPVKKGPLAKSRLQLVFVPRNYQDRKDFLKDIEVFLERLNRASPFPEFMPALGAWQIKLSPKEEKLFFKEAQDFPYLTVRQDFLKGIFAKLKAGYKLIIINASGSLSCAELSRRPETSLVILGKSRYRDKASFAKGFLHELGHSLGLRDERVECDQGCPAGAPNCAPTKEEAKKWWGDLVGKNTRVDYINGCCGNKEYFRPTIASFMNDPNRAEDFGPVNERYLREELAGE